jgi:hypothetical protein
MLILTCQNVLCLTSVVQDDFGADNTRVGHRRWFLYPDLYTIGVGDVFPSINEPTMPKASSIWIIGDHLPANLGTRVVVWPPDGFVPLFLVPTSKRVSVALEGADFTFARVNVTIAGRVVAITDQIADAWYGHPAVSFRVPTWPDLAAGDDDVSVIVKVSGIRLDDNNFLWQHESKMFDPTAAAIPPGWTGSVSRAHWLVYSTQHLLDCQRLKVEGAKPPFDKVNGEYRRHGTRHHRASYVTGNTRSSSMYLLYSPDGWHFSPSYNARKTRLSRVQSCSVVFSLTSLLCR